MNYYLSFFGTMFTVLMFVPQTSSKNNRPNRFIAQGHLANQTRTAFPFVVLLALWWFETTQDATAVCTLVYVIAKWLVSRHYPPISEYVGGHGPDTAYSTHYFSDSEIMQDNIRIAEEQVQSSC